MTILSDSRAASIKPEKYSLFRIHFLQMDLSGFSVFSTPDFLSLPPLQPGVSG
jgi:hypothetical protein